MIEIKHSVKLNLDFKIKHDKNGSRVIVFEDGVNYRNHELTKIKGCSDSAYNKIHSLKKIFQGVVVQ